MFKESMYNEKVMTQVTTQKYGTRNISQRGVNVLIVAGMRTGSSFVGYFFRSNPHFFYLFEPLLGFKDIGIWPRISVDGVNTLAVMYNCDFSGYAKHWNKYFNWLSPKTRGKKSIEHCHALGYSNVGSCCKNAQHRAAKIIRLLDVRDLIPLMESPDINLKVINLVRDPRAMMSSLMPVYYSKWNFNKKQNNKIRDVSDLNEYLTDILKQYCEQMHRNYILLNANTSLTHAWKENFIVLRFEDIALNPKKYADIMYSHVGIDIDKKVYEWIDNNTNATEHEHGGFGTAKKSSAVINDWQSKMTFNLVKKIQNYAVCTEYMSQLQYNFVENVSMYKNESIGLLNLLGNQ
ncbi:carbohydrate sulfotransferase 3-like [Glandiceps talaboti]